MNPVNIPRVAQQVIARTPPANGQPGDTIGSIAVDGGNFLYVCTANYVANSDVAIWRKFSSGDYPSYIANGGDAANGFTSAVTIPSVNGAVEVISGNVAVATFNASGALIPNLIVNNLNSVSNSLAFNTTINTNNPINISSASLNVGNGNVVVNSVSATSGFVNGKIIISVNANTNPVPTAINSNGIQGEIVFDTNYVYICVATNTWKRAPLSSW
jgi:hypothetical protein